MSILVIETVLTAAVANAANTTIAYPSGFTSANFRTGTNQQCVLNDNEFLTAAQFTIAHGASITLTNNSGTTWAVGTRVRVQLDLIGVDAPMSVTRFTVFTGRNGAGAITVPNLVAGDDVVGVVLVTEGAVVPADSAALFEARVSTAGQIQQLSASDLSAARYLVLLARRLA